MVRKKTRKKLRLSAKERARRSRQAKRNFSTRTKTKRRVRKVMAKKRTYRRRSTSQLDLIGIGVTVIAEPFIDSLTSRFGFGLPDDIVKLGAGWWLSKRRGKMMKSVGTTLMIIGARNLIRGGIGMFGTKTNSVASSGGFY